MIDYSGLTIAQTLQKAASAWDEREALASADQRYTWQQLYRKSARLAQGLSEAGIRRGDKVATIFGITPEWVFTKYALHMLGAVLVPVNVNFRAREIEYVLRQADVKTLIFTDRLPAGDYTAILEEIDPELFVEGKTALSEKLPLLESLICFSPEGAGYGRCMDFQELLEGSGRADPGFVEEEIRRGSPDEVCNILFTSGSTAFPKGAMHAHSSLLGIGAHLMGKTCRLSTESRLLCFFPFYHIAGCVYFTLGALTGGNFLYTHEFQPEKVMEVIETEKINLYCGFDAHFNALATHPNYGAYDLSTIERVVLATGPVWYDRCRDVFPSAELIAHHYGFTEGTGVSMMPDVADEEKRKYTNGRPWPGVSVKAADPASGAALPPDTPGELCLKGWTLFKGYYKSPEETEKAFDPEGFFHTGDYGWIDEDGFVVYRGRFKMMIKTGGENVSEREVEVFLESIPGVKAVQVIGLPDEKWGEAVTAVIEPSEGSGLTFEQVVEHCRKSLAGFKIPKRVLFITAQEWPLLGAGKVDKKQLKEWAGRRISGQEPGSRSR